MPGLTRPRVLAARGFHPGLLVAYLALAAWEAGPRAQEPLPDADVFLAAAKDNFARSNRVQEEFAYKERRTELHTNPFGRLGTGETLLFEITPLAEGNGFTRLLLQRDGKAVADAKVERIERRRRTAPANGQPAPRRSMDDVVSVLDFAVDRRDTSGARPAIVVRFTPRPNAKPTTRQGRLARSFSGRIWVDEQTREVTRVEAVAEDAISYGLGVLARLGKGSAVTVVREPVGGGVWMPTSIRFQGQGRALLFRKLTIDYHMEWFDYRRVPATAG